MIAFFARRPALTLAGVTLLWGSTFIVTKGVLRSAPPLVYLTVRFGIAALMLFALFPRALRAPRALLADGLLLGVTQGTGLLLQVLGQVYTTASKSAFVTSLSTALTPLVALALYGARPTQPKTLGVLLASAGLYFLTYPTEGTAWNTGDLYTGACAVVYAYVIVETARRAPRWHQGELTAVQTAVAALVFALGLAATRIVLLRTQPGAAPAVFELERRDVVLDGQLVLAVAYMTIVCTVVTFLAQTWAMARMSATHAAVVFALEPVLATALAVAREGAAEWPGPRGVIGAALVLGGVLVSELWRSRRPRSDRRARRATRSD